MRFKNHWRRNSSPKKLWHIGSDVYTTTNGQKGKVVWHVKQSKIRYAVLCYGVPLRIQENSYFKDEGPIPDMRPELRRNGLPQ